MPRIAMAYAPASPPGVTTLMSVGAVDEVLKDRTAEYVKKASYVTSAVYILGAITKNEKMKMAALGGAVTIYAIMILSGKDPYEL